MHVYTPSPCSEHFKHCLFKITFISDFLHTGLKASAETKIPAEVKKSLYTLAVFSLIHIYFWAFIYFYFYFQYLKLFPFFIFLLISFHTVVRHCELRVIAYDKRNSVCLEPLNMYTETSQHIPHDTPHKRRNTATRGFKYSYLQVLGVAPGWSMLLGLFRLLGLRAKVPILFHRGGRGWVRRQGNAGSDTRGVLKWKIQKHAAALPTAAAPGSPALRYGAVPVPGLKGGVGERGGGREGSWCRGDTRRWALRCAAGPVPLYSVTFTLKTTRPRNLSRSLLFSRSVPSTLHSIAISSL